jgi:transcriptional regulator with XRE-family HTH domain
MPDSFGARLRERREQQQVALSTIAEQTKIKVSLLDALERDDVSHWPSGIFRRAFIRAYAHAIGLEPDVIVREFLELYPDPIEIVDTLQAGAPGAEGAWVSDGPPTRFRHLVASAIGSVSRLRSRGSQRPGSVFDGSLAPPHAAHSNGSSHDATNLHDDIPNLPAIGSRIPDRASRVPDRASRMPDPGPRMPDPVSRIAMSMASTPNPVDTQATLIVQVPEAHAVPVVAQSPVIAQGQSMVPAVAAEPAPPIAYDPPPAVIADEPPPSTAARSEADLMAVAELCTELGRAETADDVQQLLQETARMLDAVGVIVWVWDAIANELRPALAHGYSDRVLAQLPRVERDTNNATAAAFRAAQTCVVKSSDQVSGALAVPLMTPAGCAGVLAIELTHRREDRGSVRALATIFAAQLAALIGASRPAEATGRMFA